MTISGNDLRDRMLERIARVRDGSPAEWVQALSSPGNRELLALIAHRRPRSISELAELSGRAQPNVSRSLSALLRAGLVEIDQVGRASVPGLTDLGREKVREFGLAPEAWSSDDTMREQATPARTSATSDRDEGQDTSVALDIAFEDPDEQHDHGAIQATLSFRSRPRLRARRSCDLRIFAEKILDDWWEILHRRDAPYALGEFSPAEHAARPFRLVVKSSGEQIEVIAPGLGTAHVPLAAFETTLIDRVLRPIAARERALRRFDESILAKLARLEETLAYHAERCFARTAGALGISPYDVSNEQADEIQRLVTDMPDDSARLDFASAVLTEDLRAATEWIGAEIETHGDRNRMTGLPALADALQSERLPASSLPWQRGTSMARALRRRMGLDSAAGLGRLRSFATRFGAADFIVSENAAPAELRGYQNSGEECPSIFVGDYGPERTAFILARAIGDYLIFRSRAACVASTYTDRQAVGRAFAAEFLAPAEGVIHMLETEKRSVGKVADHYGVVDEVVRRQYENNVSSPVDG